MTTYVVIGLSRGQNIQFQENFLFRFSCNISIKTLNYSIFNAQIHKKYQKINKFKDYNLLLHEKYIYNKNQELNKWAL